MDFGGEFTVDRPVGEVAELLKKPEELARLIPGVTKVLKSGDSYVADVVVKVGSLSGKMATRFKYLETDGGVAIVGNATGMQTAADFKIDVALSPAGEKTLVRWRFEGEARGLLATLAPTLVRDSLKKVAEETARNLQNYLQKI